jgi:hypothetical protein
VFKLQRNKTPQPWARFTVALDAVSQQTASTGGYGFAGVSPGSHTLSNAKGTCHVDSPSGPTTPAAVSVTAGATTTVDLYCSMK